MSHNHGPTPANAGAKYRRRLLVAFVLVATFFVVELIAGLMSNSLALISDAGHMAADVVSLGAALVATAIASRPDKSGRRTFGYYRAEVFASLLCVMVMYGVSIYVLIEAIGRIGQPAEVLSNTMLIVGVLGLVINLICLRLLSAGSKESLNVKGAYLEVIADAAGSVGVIAAGVMIMITGNAIWDTIISLGIAVFIIVRATILAREVFGVLGQNAPSHLNPEEVRQSLLELDGVEDVHDLHLWTLTSGMDVASVHLSAKQADQDEVLAAARTALHDKYELEHATIQVEGSNKSECSETSW